MAVTLTALELAQELRITADDSLDDVPTAQSALVGRLLATATEMVTEFAPLAPDAVQNEAVARVAGFLYDTAPGNARRFSDVLGQSGAASILSLWREVRAKSTEAE